MSKLKKILNSPDYPGPEEFNWLICRVNKLTEALEYILEKNRIDPGVEAPREELNARAASTYYKARKALEEDIV